MLPLPDLLSLQPTLALDRRAIAHVLGLVSVGRRLGTELDGALEHAAPAAGTLEPRYFARDLFLPSLIAGLRIEIEGRAYPVHARFLENVLAHAPADLETARMRQEIVRELLASGERRAALERLYVALFDLVTLHKSPLQGIDESRQDVAPFLFDILKQVQVVVHALGQGFADSASELRRLDAAAATIGSSREYRTVEALLDYERELAWVELQVTIGGDGTLRELAVKRLEENERNLFYRSPLRRLVDRLRLALRGYHLARRELLERLIRQVYQEVSGHFVGLVQLIGHLEVYLATLELKRLAERRGLAMCLPELAAERFEIEGLYNPLLLQQPEPPVPCDLALDQSDPIVLITGPNSGGKTRLLQAIALAQLFAQSGLLVPARRALMRLRPGLFVSLVEVESADQTEGRLGRELVRVRTLFEEMPPGSMVVLDELCSGTNPSEAIEVLEMVLRLLRTFGGAAFVTTHFLDFARALAREHNGYQFLQVEIDAQQRSTYQFRSGVADTSLAALTAERLGVTYERLQQQIAARRQPAAQSAGNEPT